MKLVTLTVVGLLIASRVAAEPVEVIKVTIGKDCKAAHLTGARQVTKADRGVVVWQIRSKCETPHRVAICQRPAAYALTCVGDPAMAKIGIPFEMTPARGSRDESTSIACVVNWPPKTEKYCFRAIAGGPTDDLTCVPLTSECQRENELALEAVP